MKLNELSKQELCDLIKEIINSNQYEYGVTHSVNMFLSRRWNAKCDALMDKAEKCDISTVKGFDKWRALHKELDKLQNSEAVEYYMNLEE